MPCRALIVLLCGSLLACATARTKPRIKVASNGLPSGHDTPEGVAVDLAGAFILRDAALFKRTCLRLYDRGVGPPAYATFLASTAASIEAERQRGHGERRGPESIGKVFAARHLSQTGPVSYGYAAFGFQDIMFVDVGVLLHDGGRLINRTMVVKDRDGKWYVHPAPAVSPLLSAGLNEEAPSKVDLFDVYEPER